MEKKKFDFSFQFELSANLECRFRMMYLRLYVSANSFFFIHHALKNVSITRNPIEEDTPCRGNIEIFVTAGADATISPGLPYLVRCLHQTCGHPDAPPVTRWRNTSNTPRESPSDEKCKINNKRDGVYGDFIHQHTRRSLSLFYVYLHTTPKIYFSYFFLFAASLLAALFFFFFINHDGLVFPSLKEKKHFSKFFSSFIDRRISAVCWATSRNAANTHDRYQ